MTKFDYCERTNLGISQISHVVIVINDVYNLFAKLWKFEGRNLTKIEHLIKLMK
jgi:hypothetical protein